MVRLMTSRYKKIKVGGKAIDEHRHIMQKHLGRKLGFHEVVHHLNGDPRDNRIENLEVVSRSQHSRDHFLEGIELGTHKIPTPVKGKRNCSNASLNETQVRIIRKMPYITKSFYFLGEIFAVSRGTISDIKRGVTWKWLH